MNRLFLFLMLSAPLWPALGCASPEKECSRGAEGCECLDGECFAGFECRSNLCMAVGTADSNGGETNGLTSGSPSQCSEERLADMRANGHDLSPDADKLEPYDRALCTPSWLENGTAIARKSNSQGIEPNGATLAIEFVDGDPVSVNGLACVPDPIQGADQMVTYDECKRTFFCGCCVFRFDTWTIGGVDSRNYSVDVLSMEDAAHESRRCDGITDSGSYEIETPTPYSPPASGSGGTGSSACQDCLAECRGLNVPNCCTGSGCLCQQECSATSCPDTHTRCCGSDGYCFCAEKNSPFSCPW